MQEYNLHEDELTVLLNRIEWLAGSAVSVEGISERLDVSKEFVEDVLYGRYAGIEHLE